MLDSAFGSRISAELHEERPNADPLAEEETILQFESFMCEKKSWTRSGALELLRSCSGN